MSTMRTGVAAAVASVVGYVNRPYVPTYLFQNGEQGWWYDPSDFSTLFQDAAGTTPVTAVEQPCSLMLDKRLGLTLGSELVSNPGPFTATTGWTGGNSASLSIVDGTLRVTGNGSSPFPRAYFAVSTVVGKVYKVSVSAAYVSGTDQSVYICKADNISFSSNAAYGSQVPAGINFVATATTTYIGLQANSANNVFNISSFSVKELVGNHAYTPAAASTARPTVSARVNLYLGTATLATQNVTTVATNYTLRFEGTGSVTLSGTATGTYSAGTHTITCTAGTLTTTVTGTVTNADIRPANDGVGLPVYQRVTTASDYDTVGFPVYLRADGSNDYMLTNSIDFSGTDKMTICAGVRKLSDAAIGTIAELSSNAQSNNGTFLFRGPHVVSDYLYGSSGTVFVSVEPSGYSAPTTNVLTGTSDISGDSLILRVNGSQQASSTSNQGTGNYGNYPLYMFSRAGASRFFNGRFYGGVGRGAQSNDQQIAALEGYMNTKTAAY
jgi:hypothetical protein